MSLFVGFEPTGCGEMVEMVGEGVGALGALRPDPNPRGLELERCVEGVGFDVASDFDVRPDSDRFVDSDLGRNADGEFADGDAVVVEVCDLGTAPPGAVWPPRGDDAVDMQLALFLQDSVEVVVELFDVEPAGVFAHRSMPPLMDGDRSGV